MSCPYASCPTQLAALDIPNVKQQLSYAVVLVRAANSLSVKPTLALSDVLEPSKKACGALEVREWGEVVGGIQAIICELTV